jgi:hypothetical protein
MVAWKTTTLLLDEEEDENCGGKRRQQQANSFRNTQLIASWYSRLKNEIKWQIK